MQELPTRYNPKETEEKWYKFWEEKKLFKSKTDPTKKPYCIVIPPPNITGILHMGHALNNTIQDILIRWKRMQGFSTCWLPGTDHAGIATQNVVERALFEEGIKRQDLGREKFLERVWQWKEEYGSTIIMQLKRLGSSCDWERERFTMDEGLSNAVLEVFVRLYEKGLIYQGDYIINWCPRCQTALSDEEAQHKDMTGSLYYIKYPIKDSKEHVVVATTRPETMLGDTAVAINPKDKRFKDLVGKHVILPIINRELEVIKDDIVDPKFGTGIVKVTPAHDPNDFLMGQKHNLEFVNVMNPDATMNENAGEYQGMDRFECREALLQDLKERGLLLKIEQHSHAVGHCYRCHTMVEPYLSKQWFVKMKPLAEPGIKVVEDGTVKFIPPRWKKVYLEWMENIRDWCISRQIWWGHRIPVYYCKNCREETGILKSKIKNQKSKIEKGVIVSKTKPEKCPGCGGTELVQDEDVLDTWFSSWLWPFSTFGWPEKQADLKYFYPTSTLITAQEIIFFWVARMIMAGLEFMGDIPFRDVYIHGTVRDATGTKMSKSLGNIIDPLEIIDVYGADALRFSLVSITAVGQDVFLAREKFEIGRNFANKIWNASRFVLMNLDESLFGIQPKASDLSLADKWILSRLNHTIKSVTDSLAKYRFNEAAGNLYEFFWHEFCDWYVELAKPVLVSIEAKPRYNRRLSLDTQRATAQQVICYVLETSLRLLHPIMPFITEEIWQKLKGIGYRVEGIESVMVAEWPKVDKSKIDEKAEKTMRLLVDIIVAVRNIRAQMNVPSSKMCEVILSVTSDSAVKTIKLHEDYIKGLARASEIKVAKKVKRPLGAATAVLKEAQVFVPLAGLIDLGAERSRLNQQVEKLKQEMRSLSQRLRNKKFLEKAPKEVVAKEKQRQDELKKAMAKLKQSIKALE